MSAPELARAVLAINIEQLPVRVDIETSNLRPPVSYT